MSVVVFVGLITFFELLGGMISVTDFFQNFDCTLDNFVI